jgi:hypothetical protein
VKTINILIAIEMSILVIKKEVHKPTGKEIFEKYKVLNKSNKL